MSYRFLSSYAMNYRHRHSLHTFYAHPQLNSHLLLIGKEMCENFNIALMPAADLDASNLSAGREAPITPQ